MAGDRLIGLKCPNCAKVHSETLAHLEAHWQNIFSCDKCGIGMKVDREQASATVDAAGDEGQIIIEMVEDN